MSYVDPEPEGPILFQPAQYIDEATKQRRIVPAAILAAPMVIAFVALLWLQGSMTAWAVSGPRLADGDWYLLLLHMFAHGGLAHIGFNLYALLVLGPPVMERLGRLSPRSISAFFALFFVSGLAGAWTWLALHPTSEIPMLGASGAIFGLLGFLVRQPDPQKVPVPLISREMGMALIEWIKLHIPLILIFVLPMLFGSGFFGLAWEAHLGGFLAGMILAPALIGWVGTGPDWVYLDDAQE